MDFTATEALREKLQNPEALADFVFRFARQAVADQAVHLYYEFGTMELKKREFLPDDEAAHDAVWAKVRHRLSAYVDVFGEDAWNELWAQIEEEARKSRHTFRAKRST